MTVSIASGVFPDVSNDDGDFDDDIDDGFDDDVASMILCVSHRRTYSGPV